MNKLWTVAKSVYRKNVFSWSFVWMVASPLIMVGVFGLIGYFIGQSEATKSGDIALIQASPEIQHIVEENKGHNQIILDLNQEEAQAALRDDKIDGYLEVGEEEGQIKANFFHKTTSSDVNLDTIEKGLQDLQVLQLAESLGLSQDDLAKLQNQSVAINVNNLNFGEDGKLSQEEGNSVKYIIRSGMAYFTCFIVFFFIISYVNIIAQEIAAEKGSRIMEIILSSIPARTHFFGKMIGVGLMILTQIACYLVLYLLGAAAFTTSLVSLPIPEELLENLHLGSLIQEAIPIFALGLVFALIGILIYTSFAGFLGSLVSKTEDVQKTIMPVVFLGVAGFYIGLFAFASSANNALVRISSQIPFFTPFVMPFRVAGESVSNFEIGLSIVLSLITMVAIFYLSAAFYKSNVLTYSDKGMVDTLKRSWTLWRSEKKA
ncbi:MULTISPECIES: ABC transporter permease [Aerococcus]|uniref:ABC transporter permease n=1 Tax=Aerococcus sanguinicola TaxID=119206 RepID=A0A5N1GLI7_9LACT|nr:MULTISPECIES: ABC transporter permease [Aerococcus]KAA9301148.1 ABC transporter permease [Aerococcus sanguinicola]MDK6369323.1 ABC transporter permease [Aerococcus sp. UMB9870]MDK6679148.1 ABC transporter permease [Aerococcus sp. UMB8608]MDK6687167.1 ABC transporter permease [Aerococcus sp. UMB8623]MDK6941123.1 ABC transporter permease [Aerococcus sp. UMB8487]